MGTADKPRVLGGTRSGLRVTGPGKKKEGFDEVDRSGEVVQ
jgi:hypothetical protein